MRVRVLGHKRIARGSPLLVWAYSAEAYDERDSSKSTMWSCGHEHKSPLQAQTCGLLSFPEAVPEETRPLGAAQTA
jgi:hypothetical protein